MLLFANPLLLHHCEKQSSRPAGFAITENWEYKYDKEGNLIHPILPDLQSGSREYKHLQCIELFFPSCRICNSAVASICIWNATNNHAP
jgi:hypothetical protein